MQTETARYEIDITAWDTETFLQVVRAAAAWLERNRERINALNVFPVPDGDTGDNMMLTLRGALKALESKEPASLADACDALAEGALQGSRGNSGVILSQMLAGFAAALRDADRVTPQVLAAAFLRAAEEGFKAHSEPVEGTMMTVMRDVAHTATALAAQPLSLAEFLQAVLDEARESVERTQTLLPRLQQAGVVDAGGEGIAVLLEGVVRFFSGEPLDALVIAGASHQAANLDELDMSEEDRFGYCTNFLLSGEDIDVDAFRRMVLGLGRSALVVGNSRAVKVHVHTEQPGEIITRALQLGTLHQLKLDNMDDQYRDLLVAKRRAEASTPPRSVATALVAVVAGDGFRRLFEHDAGAIVVAGGQSMNPSTGDLLEAIERAPGEAVVLLPNNPNVIMSARKAADSSGKRVAVLPTRSAPAGVVAALQYGPDVDLDRNLQAMQAAVSDIAYVELTRAVRDAEIDGVAVRRGDYIGLVDDKLVASAPGLVDAAVATLGLAGAADRELLTLYSGRDASPEDVDAVSRAAEERWPGLEVSTHHGGQPHYVLVASLE
jgi:DAK2 domain fusion protein YloV